MDLEALVPEFYFPPTAGKTPNGKLKRAVGKAGRWSVRRRMGDGRYATESLNVLADDVAPANNKGVLSYDQAVRRIQGISKLVGGADISVKDAATDWADWKSLTARDHRSRINYRSTARRIAEAFPRKTLRTITTGDLTRYRDRFLAEVDRDRDDYMEALCRRRSTANRSLATVKAVLNRAAQEHGYGGDRVWNNAKKFSKAENFGSRQNILTPDQCRTLLISIEDDAFRDLVHIALLTGCRYGELRTARVRDLDVSAKTLDVDGKTGPRTITIGNDALSILKRLTDRVNNKRRCIFLRSNGKEWDHDDQQDPMSDAVEAAGLEPGTVFYDLRHTCLSKWIADGVPIRAVAEQAGTSVEMLERSYAKFIPDQKQQWFSSGAV